MMPSNPSFAAGKSKKFVKKLLRQITEEHKKEKARQLKGQKRSRRKS
ncbi:hypothetical protein HMPREF9439_00544 [Parasutterella excrementihominis YIT 11859]|uniref:Uncharacterized protein n=1 Tax=Parasutterella excrementihominis YIT 11859 TaxID=762966 RepID=F3QHZ7_9BURK|nr:hypothetical protein HMPREF9439_00544 [Parasutterella excrementihominis YIT 11859]